MNVGYSRICLVIMAVNTECWVWADLSGEDGGCHWMLGKDRFVGGNDGCYWVFDIGGYVWG